MAAVDASRAQLRPSRRQLWLREIKKYQASVVCLIPRVAIQRLAREISQDYKIECKVSLSGAQNSP